MSPQTAMCRISQDENYVVGTLSSRVQVATSRDNVAGAERDSWAFDPKIEPVILMVYQP